MALLDQTLLTTVYDAIDGAAATGTITYGSNPADASTIVINGVTFNIKDSPSAGEIQRGGSLADTLTSMAEILNASVNAAVSVATYTASTTVLTITYDTAGTAGNAFTITAGTSGGTRSAATLENGVDGYYASTTIDPVSGVVTAAQASSAFEKNLLVLAATVEKVLLLTANPATSDATFVQAAQQRKLVKRLLNKAADLVYAPDGASDDRVTSTDAYRSAVLNFLAGVNRVDTL